MLAALITAILRWGCATQSCRAEGLLLHRSRSFLASDPQRNIAVIKNSLPVIRTCSCSPLAAFITGIRWGCTLRLDS